MSDRRASASINGDDDPSSHKETASLINRKDQSDTVANSLQPGGNEIDEVINEIGLGPFQWKILALCAAASFSISFEAVNLGLLIPVVKEFWALTERQLGIFITVANLGLGIGALVFGALSDRYDRMVLYKASFFVLALFGVLQMASPDVYFLAFCRFFLGMAFSVNQMQSTILITELTPSKFRGRFYAFSEAFAGLGVIGTVCLSWSSTDLIGWRMVIVITALPCFVTGLVFMVLLPYSPHYLAGKKRNEEAIKALLVIARENGASADMLAQISRLSLNADTNVDAMGSPGFLELFSPLLLKMTVILSAIWLFGTASTRLLMWIPLYMKEHPELAASGNELLHSYGSALLLAIGDTAGPLISLSFIHLVDRRRIISGALMIIVFLVFFMGIVKSAPWIVGIMPVLAGTSRVLVVITSLFTPEVYPTVVRATAVGYLTGLQWLMIVASHWVVANILTWSFASFVTIYAVQCVAAAIGSFWLPYDTRNKHMAQHFYEAYELQQQEKRKAEQQQAQA